MKNPLTLIFALVNLLTTFSRMLMSKLLEIIFWIRREPDSIPKAKR